MTLPAILYDNRLADATPVASSTAAGNFNVLNLTDWAPYTEWRPAAMPATVTVDSGVARAADYALVWAHDLGSQGATFEVRRSTDAFAANDILVASTVPADDKPFALYWPSESWQHWRIRLTGATAPTMAIAAIGALFELPQYFEAGFDPVGGEPRGRFNRSVTGAPLSTITDYEEWSGQVDLSRVSWAWARTLRAAWDAHLRDNPFVLAWERVTWPGELHLVVREGRLETPHLGGGKADVRFGMKGVRA